MYSQLWGANGGSTRTPGGTSPSPHNHKHHITWFFCAMTCSTTTSPSLHQPSHQPIQSHERHDLIMRMLIRYVAHARARSHPKPSPNHRSRPRRPHGLPQTATLLTPSAGEKGLQEPEAPSPRGPRRGSHRVGRCGPVALGPRGGTIFRGDRGGEIQDRADDASADVCGPGKVRTAPLLW